MGDRTKNIGEGVPANHAARAVDITAIWPEIPAGDSKRQQAAAAAGARGVSAEPMHPGERDEHYVAQNNGRPITARQERRAVKKMRAGGWMS